MLTGMTRNRGMLTVCCYNKKILTCVRKTRPKFLQEPYLTEKNKRLGLVFIRTWKWTVLTGQFKTFLIWITQLKTCSPQIKILTNYKVKIENEQTCFSVEIFTNEGLSYMLFYMQGVYEQNEGLKLPSSSSSTNTPRWYLPLHPKAQIGPAVLLQKCYHL